MTIEEMMKKTGAKKKTVQTWLKNREIPGAEPLDDGTWYIPESARRPYHPHCGAGSSLRAIHTSMVNACLKGCHFTYKTYGLSRDEFDACIGRLERADLLEVHLRDGIPYYDPTLKSMGMAEAPLAKLQKFVAQCLGEVAKGAAYGVAKAYLDKIA